MHVEEQTQMSQSCRVRRIANRVASCETGNGLISGQFALLADA